jgi:hypothetical protein
VRGVQADAAKRDHAERRLRDEKIAWLTTVRRDGQPQSSPVWFLRDIDEGGDVVSIDGEAAIDERYPQASAIPAYVEKYRAMIADLRMDPASFAKAYSVPIRIRPIRVRVE